MVVSRVVAIGMPCPRFELQLLGTPTMAMGWGMIPTREFLMWFQKKMKNGIIEPCIGLDDTWLAS